MMRALTRLRSVTARRQLRWIVWGSAVGALPFVAAVRRAAAHSGTLPPYAEYTAVLLGCIPLAFASAHRALPADGHRGHHQEGARGRRRSCSLLVVIYSGMLQLVELSLGPSRDAAVSGRSSRRWSSRSSRRGCGTRFRRPRSAVLPRPLRLPPRARELRARAEQRSRSRPPEPAARRARARHAGGRRDRALSAGLAAGRGGRFVAVASAGFDGARLPAIRRASLARRARLPTGQTAVIDDPLPLRRFSGEEARRVARGRPVQLRALRVEGRDDRGDRGRPPRRGRAAQQRGHGAARRGGRPGRDGARERAAVRAAQRARPTRSSGCASSATASSSR